LHMILDSGITFGSSPVTRWVLVTLS